MKYCYVTFRSVTHAQRGERLLQTEGIRSSLLRTPKWMEARGCGYSLRLKTDEIREAVELLRRKNIPMQKVYIRGDDEDMEELRL